MLAGFIEHNPACARPVGQEWTGKILGTENASPSLSRYITLVQIVIFRRLVGVITNDLRVLLNLVRARVVEIGFHTTMFVWLSGLSDLWLFDA